MNLVVRAQLRQRGVEFGDDRIPASVAADPPTPSVGDATEHDGEGLAVLLSILGNVHRVQDALVVEGNLSKLSERRGHVVGNGLTTGETFSERADG